MVLGKVTKVVVGKVIKLVLDDVNGIKLVLDDVNGIKLVLGNGMISNMYLESYQTCSLEGYYTGTRGKLANSY